jgi:hypothetical protein
MRPYIQTRHINAGEGFDELLRVSRTRRQEGMMSDRNAARIIVAREIIRAEPA